MLRSPASPIDHPVRTIATSLKAAHESLEAAERQRVELRLTVMETKVRIAELKATLRRLQRYLHPGDV